MAWIESHEELPTHPKTRKLARKLGVSVPTVIGHLHVLWYWCLTHRPDGVLEGMDADDVADAAGWDDDGEPFVKALLLAGWLDDDNGQLVIHDWWDGAGKTIKRRKYATSRQRRARESQDNDAPVTDESPYSHDYVTRDTQTGHGADSDSDSDKDLNPSLLPEGEQAPGKKSWRDAYPPPGKLERNAYPPSFEDVWTAYPPNNGAKKAAYRTWRSTVLADGEDVIPQLLAAATHYRELVTAERRERGKIKHAETFFGPDEHWRTYVEKPEQTTVEPDRRSKGAYL